MSAVTPGSQDFLQDGGAEEHGAQDPCGPGGTMEVLLFAGLAEAAGCARLELAPPWPETVSQLRERLGQQWPALARATFRTAVNQRYVQDTEALCPGDEIALIPPVSGG